MKSRLFFSFFRDSYPEFSYFPYRKVRDKYLTITHFESFPIFLSRKVRDKYFTITHFDSFLSLSTEKPGISSFCKPIGISGVFVLILLHNVESCSKCEVTISLFCVFRFPFDSCFQKLRNSYILIFHFERIKEKELE